MTHSSSRPSLRNRVLLILLLLAIADRIGGCRSLWLNRAHINTSDFKSIRSAIEPDLLGLFAEAREEFAGRGHWYEMEQYTAKEKYNVLRLHITQFEAKDGTTYDVLFAFTSGPRGFGEGYYYTPSGNLPLWAPTYGIVCSKRLDGSWYAFRTVDSQNPPDPKYCPEDVQYLFSLR